MAPSAPPFISWAKFKVALVTPELAGSRTFRFLYNRAAEPFAFFTSFNHYYTQWLRLTHRPIVRKRND